MRSKLNNMNVFNKEGLNPLGEPYIEPSASIVGFANSYADAFAEARDATILPPKRYTGLSGFNVFPIKTVSYIETPSYYRGEMPNDLFPLSESPKNHELWMV